MNDKKREFIKIDSSERKFFDTRVCPLVPQNLKPGGYGIQDETTVAAGNWAILPIFIAK
jgi:hypothetical protein